MNINELHELTTKLRKRDLGDYSLQIVHIDGDLMYETVGSENLYVDHTHRSIVISKSANLHLTPINSII